MSSTNPNMAGFASAMDKATKGLASGMQNREQAQLEKQTATMQMKQQQRSDQTGAWQAEMDRIKAENKTTQGKLDKEIMFRNLRYFTEDPNPRFLNDLLKMPIFEKAGIARFSKLDKNADQALIAQAGLDMEDLTDTGYGDNGDSSRYVKRIMQDGTEAIQDIYQVKKMSGYFKSISDAQQAEELALNEDTKKKGNKEYSPSELEKKSKYLAELGVTSEKEAATKYAKDSWQGNKAGNMEAAQQARNTLDEEYNGSFEVNFDPTDQKQRTKAYPYIRQIEEFGDVNLDAVTKKELLNIGELVSLGEPLSELKEEETGLYDAFTFKLDKYWSDEGGSSSAASFNAFRNVIRHTLYGSALTDSEIEAFDSQLGTVNKKLGPLLKESAVALGQVKGKIDMLVALNDPYVVAYRMGITMDKLEDIQENLGKTITYLERKSQGKKAIDPRQSEEDLQQSYEDQI